MKRSLLAVVLLLGGTPSPVPCVAQKKPQAGPSQGRRCLAAARRRAAEAYQKGATPEAARRQLEIDAASCLDPNLKGDAAHVVGVVNADRARFAPDLVAGRMTMGVYRAALRDRRDKLAVLLRDPPQQNELVNGDSDGDLVSDRRDRCPKTPYGAPTDARGCPVYTPPRPEDQRDDRLLRATLGGSQVLYNKSCDGAPKPHVSAPLEWGRGNQTKIGKLGFNIAVAKVGGQPPGCEVFYEIQFRFTERVNNVLPPSKIITVVFSQSEDLLNEPLRAVFPLPVGPEPITLSPARWAAREAMLRQYMRITWRVRAVNGSNLTSEWSPFITQGPASGGVPA